jgi:hypothetical protein
MKKIATICAAVVAALSFTSCEQNPSSVTLENDIDSLSYAFGMAQTHSPRGSLVSQLNKEIGLDTAYIDEFIKGFYESATLKDDPKQLAHNIGIIFGLQMQMEAKNLNKFYFDGDSIMKVNENYIYAGFMAGVANKFDIMKADSAMIYFNEKRIARRHHHDGYQADVLRESFIFFLIALEMFLRATLHATADGKVGKLFEGSLTVFALEHKKLLVVADDLRVLRSEG